MKNLYTLETHLAYNQSSQPRLFEFVKHVFPDSSEARAASEGYGWGIKIEGVSIDLCYPRGGYYSSSKTISHVALSIDGPNYKSIRRKVMVKDKSIDVDEFLKKFGELKALISNVKAQRKAKELVQASNQSARIELFRKAGYTIETYGGDALYFTEPTGISLTGIPDDYKLTLEGLSSEDTQSILNWYRAKGVN